MTEIESSGAGAEVVAFDRFYAQVEPLLRRALVASLGPSSGAEAAAVAMAYGFEHWPRIATLENPSGYLYRVGRNSARDRRKPLPDMVIELDRERGFEPELPRAMERLTESQRQAVLLVNAWGYSLSEAAAVLGVSVSTLRNHLDRGMKRLRRDLGANS